MQKIQDASEEWSPTEEGEELIGTVMGIGWDQESGVKAANVQPVDKTHIIRVWPRDKWLGDAWREAEVEEGDRIRIKYLGEKEMWKESQAEEGPKYEDYRVDVLD